jgi:hypothetical protein
MTLDPSNFRRINGLFRASMRTDRDGLVDLVVCGKDVPSPAAFLELDHAAAEIDWLYKRGVAAAAHHREAVLNWDPVPETDWRVCGLRADDSREIVVTLYEGEVDTYGDWDVVFRDSDVQRLARRQI